MKNNIVSYKTAKNAKKKGFNEKCFYLYRELEDQIIITDNEASFHNTTLEDFFSNQHDKSFETLAPLQSQLQEWLRNAKELDIIITPNFNMPIDFVLYNFNNGLVDESIELVDLRPNGVYIFHIIKNFNSLALSKDEDYTSYEEALENALQSALKLI